MQHLAVATHSNGHPSQTIKEDKQNGTRRAPPINLRCHARMLNSIRLLAFAIRSLEGLARSAVDTRGESSGCGEHFSNLFATETFKKTAHVRLVESEQFDKEP
jgi:hypothetical protein